MAFKELIVMLAVRGKWWMIPVCVLLIIVGCMLILAQIAPILSPFIYAIF